MKVRIHGHVCPFSVLKPCPRVSSRAVRINMKYSSGKSCCLWNMTGIIQSGPRNLYGEKGTIQ